MDNVQELIEQVTAGALIDVRKHLDSFGIEMPETTSAALVQVSVDRVMELVKAAAPNKVWAVLSANTDFDDEYESVAGGFNVQALYSNPTDAQTSADSQNSHVWNNHHMRDWYETQDLLGNNNYDTRTMAEWAASPGNSTASLPQFYQVAAYEVT